MDVVWWSAAASLGVQLVVGAVTAAAFFVEYPAGEEDGLKVIVGLEFASQVVEFLWYLWIVLTRQRIRTWYRYVDWVVSTPVMLLSTAMFLSLRRMPPGGDSLRAVLDVFEDPGLYATLGFNWWMLAFGYLLERGTLRPLLGLAMGGVGLVGSFTFLARFVDAHDAVSMALFFTMYAIWSLYGVAAALDDVPKNVAYNGLDVVSKNFYGLFLYVYVVAREWFD